MSGNDVLWKTDDVNIKSDSRKDWFIVLRVQTLKVEINVGFLHLKSWLELELTL